MGNCLSSPDLKSWPYLVKQHQPSWIQSISEMLDHVFNILTAALLRVLRWFSSASTMYNSIRLVNKKNAFFNYNVPLRQHFLPFYPAVKCLPTALYSANENGRLVSWQFCQHMRQTLQQHSTYNRRHRVSCCVGSRLVSIR